jgi:RHS repeat-associated protein
MNVKLLAGRRRARASVRRLFTAVLFAGLLPLTARADVSWIQYETVPPDPFTGTTHPVVVNFYGEEGMVYCESFCYYYDDRVDPNSFALTVNGQSRTSSMTVTQTNYSCTYGPHWDDWVCGWTYRASGSPHLWFNGGTNTLRASVLTFGFSDWYEIYVTYQYTTPPSDKLYPVVSTAPHNGENRDVSLCVAQCFDAVLSYATPAYITMDTPRSVTLVYRSGQADAKPVVQVDARDESPTPASKMSIGLQRPNGSWVNLIGGATEVFYQRGAGDSRLAAQFDASSLATGAHDYTVVVRSWWPDGTMREATAPVKVLILNEKDSEFGWGWSVAGLQRIHEQADGAVVLSEGSGSIRRFPRLSCPSTCSYESPNGDFTTLTRRATWADGRKWDRRYADGTTAVYQVDGRLAYVRDRFGNQTTFAYSGSPSRLASITDPVGKQITFGYGADGKLDWIRDAGNRYTYVTIDAALNVTAIQDPGSLYSLTVTYDTRHRPMSRIDRRGAPWATSYDFAGKIGADTSPTVAAEGQNVRLVTQFRAAESAILVDPGSGFGTSSNPAPRIVPAEIRARTTNPRGYATAYQVDRFNAPLRVEAPLGRVTTFTRNQHSQPVAQISPSGHLIEFGWLGTNMSWLADRTTGKRIWMEYEWTYGELTRIYGDADSVWNYWSGGKLDSTETGTRSRKATTFTYDSRGRVLTSADPRGHTTRYFYATSGWMNTDSLKNESRKTSFIYDGLGRTNVTTNALSQSNRVEYDGVNRVVKAVGPMSDTTRYGYDGLFLTSLRDAKGQEYRFAPNAVGWVDSVIDPNGRRDQFRYDRNGNRTTWINRRAQTISMGYDELDNLRSRTADNATTTFVVDPLGRFVAVANNESTDTLRLDVAGRSISEITVRAGTRYELSSIYDLRDRRTQAQMSAPGWSASIGYRYDARSRLDTLIDVAGGRTILGYDDDALASSVILPNGLTMARGYPSTHAPSRVEYGDASVNTAIGRNYGYDELSRVRERLNAARSAGTEFSYDPLGQLTGAYDFHLEDGECTPIYEDGQIIPDPGEEPIDWNCTSNRVVDRTLIYAYDTVGNRKDSGALTQWGNRLEAFDGFTMTYDADGNLLQKTKPGFEQRFFWNSMSQLDSAITNGTVVRFGYDGLGRRTRKGTSAAMTNYIYDGEDLFAELNGSGALVAEYTYYPGVDKPHSVRRNGAIYYFASDHPGNVVGLIDSGGNVVNSYLYGAFGSSEHVSEGIVNRLRFGAREFDVETGLYQQRARYYDPDVGRFISEDPIGLAGGINPYTYVANDPVNRLDPTGMDWTCKTEPFTVIDDAGNEVEGERTVCTNAGGDGSLEGLEELCAACADVLEALGDWAPLFHRPAGFEVYMRDQHGHLHVWIVDGYLFTRVGAPRRVGNRLVVARYYVDPLGAVVNSEGLYLWWATVEVETMFRGPLGWERRFSPHRPTRGTVRGAHTGSPWIRFRAR